MVKQTSTDGRLAFTTELALSVAESNVVFIGVETPSLRGDGHADLSFVYSAAADVARDVRGFTVVVTKSTVPVGTGDEVERTIRHTNPAAGVVVVSNSKFLREARLLKTSNALIAS